MKIRVCILLCCVIPLLNACKVDPSYDLSKLNTEMTLLKGSVFPVPSPDPIYLKDIIQLDGYPYINTNDEGDYYIHFNVPRVRMDVQVPAALDGNRIPTGFEPIRYSFGAIPDFLSMDGNHVEPDLSQIHVFLDLESDIPADLSVNCTLASLRGGSVQQKMEIDDLAVPSGFTQYTLRERSFGDLNEVVVPGLGRLLSPVPDEFQVSALDVFAKAGLDRVDHEKTYHFLCDALVWAPICFSADTRFRVTVPLDAGLDLEQVGLKRAILYGEVENTIPLDFTMNLYALDSAGNRISTIRFSQPGDQRIPGLGTAPLSLELNTDGDLRFSSLVLDLTASSNASLAGTLFNTRQGITLRNLYLELPDGIVTKLDE